MDHESRVRLYTENGDIPVTDFFVFLLGGGCFLPMRYRLDFGFFLSTWHIKTNIIKIQFQGKEALLKSSNLLKFLNTTRIFSYTMSGDFLSPSKIENLITYRSLSKSIIPSKIFTVEQLCLHKKVCRKVCKCSTLKIWRIFENQFNNS